MKIENIRHSLSHVMAHAVKVHKVNYTKADLIEKKVKAGV